MKTRYNVYYWQMCQVNSFFQYTNAKYERLVQPKQEATFDYGFIPSENFAGRPLGLVVLLRYSDSVCAQHFWQYFGRRCGLEVKSLGSET